MLIRCLIKFFRIRVWKLEIYVPSISTQEREVLTDLFTTKNYIPHQGLIMYKSYNQEFIAYLFSMKSFC